MDLVTEADGESEQAVIRTLSRRNSPSRRSNGWRLTMLNSHPPRFGSDGNWKIAAPLIHDTVTFVFISGTNQLTNSLTIRWRRT